MIDLIPSLAWPFIAIIFGIIFRRPIYKLLNGLASKVEKAKIRIGNIEWDVVDLEEVIADREILRLGIHMANADKDFSDAERSYLLYTAKTMRRYVETLSREAKNRVLREVIQIALADKVFRKEEYEEILRHAERFQISKSAIEELVRHESRQSGIELPPQMKEPLK